MMVESVIATQVEERQAQIIVSSQQFRIAPPPMDGGDRLTRYEFERRYEAMPWVKKAELIEGVVYMPTPVRNSHSEAHSWIIGWLTNYFADTPGVRVGDNATVRLDMDNEPQPDALLRLDQTVGGQSRVGEDDYIEGAPELIFEVAGTSASYDLHDKMNAYRRNGVQEYVVWCIYEDGLAWFRLESGEYVPLGADEAGVMRSEAFPGLWLDAPALLKGDLAQVLDVLRKGLATEEHQAFVEHLEGLLDARE
jgi:Uma2 family endonuclease